jgi:hypothetical protein
MRPSPRLLEAIGRILAAGVLFALALAAAA